MNLYVFYGAWLNDKLSKFGYQHRGFSLRYRDWDTPECEANGGKSYSLPADDPFLRGAAHQIPTVTALCQKLHPGEKYYLTNIQASGLKPADVRAWSDDLWLFPYYTQRGMIPFDARSGGPAALAWPGETDADSAEAVALEYRADSVGWFTLLLLTVPVLLLLAVATATLLLVIRQRSSMSRPENPSSLGSKV